MAYISHSFYPKKNVKMQQKITPALLVAFRMSGGPMTGGLRLLPDRRGNLVASIAEGQVACLGVTKVVQHSLGGAQ